jgi:hypothetical protein
MFISSASHAVAEASMLVPKLGTLSGLIVVAASSVACGSQEEARIVAERTRFRDIVPEEYVIAACGAGVAPGCTREVVIAGRVVTAEVAAAGSAAWRPVPELGAWVDQATMMFEAALESAGSLRTLEFEPRWHFVSEYHLDGDGGRRVTCFLPNRVDLQQCQADAVAFGSP